MNKKFLAIAVAAAIAPVAASADVKVYGIAQVEYSIEDLDCTGCDSVQAVDDNGGRSRIGFKFSEKLGGGLTAFGKAEFRIDPADNSSNGTSGNATSVSGGLGQRDVFVGIKGSWGALAGGSFNSPYKVAGGVKWDPFAATHLQARRAGGMSGGAGIGGHNGFMRNAIHYTSPNVNGFQVAFAISPDETNTSASNGGDDGDNDYSLSVNYKNGPWHAIFAHNRNNNPDTAARSAVTGVYVDTAGAIQTGAATANALGVIVPNVTAQAAGSVDDETLTKLGLRWKSGPWTVAGQYEMIDDANKSSSGSAGTSLGAPGSAGNDSYAPTRGSDADILWLNAQYKAGNNIFTVSYGNTDVDSDTAGSDHEYDMWTLGVIHKFSKKTRVFGGYTQTDGDDNGNANDRDAWSVGIRQDF